MGVSIIFGAGFPLSVFCPLSITSLMTLLISFLRSGLSGEEKKEELFQKSIA